MKKILIIILICCNAGKVLAANKSVFCSIVEAIHWDNVDKYEKFTATIPLKTPTEGDERIKSVLFPGTTYLVLVNLQLGHLSIVMTVPKPENNTLEYYQTFADLKHGEYMAKLEIAKVKDDYHSGDQTRLSIGCVMSDEIKDSRKPIFRP